MLPDNLISITADILKTAIKSPQPTDQIVSKLLREKKYIGSKERKFVSETIFTALRNLTTLEEHVQLVFTIEPATINIGLVVSLLLFSENDSKAWAYNPNELLAKIYPNQQINILDFVANVLINKNIISKEESSNWISKTQLLVSEFANQHSVIDEESNNELISTYYSCPVWISEDVTANGYSALQLAKSITVPAKVCIRPSENRNLGAVISMLESKSIPFHVSDLIKDCVILDKRAKIDDTEEYRNGLFEVQDEGSQMIGHALYPKGRCTILDACAGAGGKTLQLAKLCPEADQIVASDTEFLRIKELAKRLRRYNFKNILPKHAISMNHKALFDLYGGHLFDYVLVDAPCTGIGTARRDPLKKYRTTKKIAEKMHSRQVEILTTYARFVKPGGVLVYATCSILSIENKATIEDFMQLNPEFVCDDLYSVLARQDINPKGLAPGDCSLSLMPHIHGTDGFFMARMKRLD